MSDERERMRGFWDEKAKDNPLWYVHSGLDFQSPDEVEFWRSGEEEVVAALDGAEISGGGLAIDIGVGAGRLSRALSSRFEAVWACDVSPEMAAVARKNLEGVPNVSVNVVPGDGSLPGVRDASADLVLSLQVMQHIPSVDVQARYIREAGRALKPGTRAVFQFRSLLRPDARTGLVEAQARRIVEAARRARRAPPGNLDSPAWRGARIGIWQIDAAARAGGMRLVRRRWISREGASLIVVMEKR